MPDPSANPSAIATSALQGIPFSSLIGAPLNAAIEAQGKAAKSTVDFIKGVGLTGTDENRKVIQVDFMYEAEGQQKKLSVPLLTIVPIPYLAIDELDIRFKASIKADAETSQEDTSSTTDSTTKGADGSVGWGPWSAKANFNASYSSKKDSKATQQSKYSVEYTMDVHVHAGQDDMPAGLAKVLGILEQSIKATPSQPVLQALQAKITLKVNDPSMESNEVSVNFGSKAANVDLTLTPGTISGFGSFKVNPTKLDSDGKANVKITYTRDALVTTPTNRNVDLVLEAKGIKQPIKLEIQVTP